MKTYRIFITSKENHDARFTFFGNSANAAACTTISVIRDIANFDANHFEIYEDCLGYSRYLVQAYNLENGTWKKCFKNR